MVLPTGGRKPGIPGQSRNELTDRILGLGGTLEPISAAWPGIEDFKARMDPGTALAVTEELVPDGSGVITARARRMSGRSLGIVPGQDVSNAITEAVASARTVSTDMHTVVELEEGFYYVHEVEIPTSKFHFVGPSNKQVEFRYNGEGGPGSHLFNCSAGLFWGGFEGIRFCGVDSMASPTTVAENLLQIGGTVDLTGVMRRLAFIFCFGDAIKHTGEGYTNWLIEHVRWDGIGGYAISLTGDASLENRPFMLWDWTIDNAVNNPAISSFLQSEGYFNGTNWGKGLLTVDNSKGMALFYGKGRAEFNNQLISDNGKRAMIYDRTTAGQDAGHHEFLQTYGYFSSRDMAATLRYTSARTGVRFLDDSAMREGIPALYDTDPDLLTEGLHGVSGVPGGWALNPQRHRGIRVGRQLLVESDGGYPTTVFDNLKMGDKIFRRNTTPGTHGVGYIVVRPTGLSRMTDSTITTGAVVTSGSTSVEVPANNASGAPPGSAITLVGAGTAGADLNTTVTDIDPDTGTWIVADTPSTSVNPCTIKWQVAQLAEFGDIVTYGTAPPSTGQHFRGERCFNTEPSPGGYVGWVCVSSGTPGSWKGFGAIES